MKFLLIYSKVFDLESKNILSQIGGVQRYLYELGKIIKKNFNTEVCIVQLGVEEKIYKFEGLEILQFKQQSMKELIKKLIKNNKLGENDIIIWGSDTLSIRTKYKSIAIQHGIACDFFSRESSLQRVCYKSPLLASCYKFLQLIRSYMVFENAEFKVCVDYNYLNWYRTINIYRNNMHKISVIPNFSYIPKIEKTSDTDKLVISFARRFHHKRGAKLLCNVAEELLAINQNIEFWFSGEGEELQFILNLQSKYPTQVKLTKFSQDETFKYHQLVDIAVIPTIASEGTSLSLLEAMASYCAVVCTNIGGMTNIVLDEFNGLIVNPDHHQLKAALLKLISDVELRKKLANNARLTVEQSFNINIWERKWVDFINMVLNTYE